MITTGFKLFAGLSAVALLAAGLYGYTSGGSHLGPLTVGYKGGVGDHIGYAILLTFAAVNAVMAAGLIYYRDADASAAASYLHVAEAPAGQRPLGESLWPLGAALGVGIVVVGLVVSPAIFVVGLVILTLVILEWTVSAWADRATGDPAANAELRDRVMAPWEVPLLAVLLTGGLVLAMSRVLLAVSETTAVFLAMVIAAFAFFAAVFFAYRPVFPRRLAVSILVVSVLAVLVGGIVAAAVGQRDFEHEEEGHSEEALVEVIGADS